MSDEMISMPAKLAFFSKTTPTSPAVSCGALTITYDQLHHMSNRVARALKAKGVKMDDLVTLGLPNGIEFVVACWAIWKLGATPQPISYRLPVSELRAIMDLAQTPVVIANFDVVLDRPLLSVSELLDQCADKSDLPDATSKVSKAPTSGGSTGRPKLILSGSPAVTFKEAPEVALWRMTQATIALIPAPLYHNAGFGMMMAAINLGAHLVVMARFDPEGFLEELERRQATWTYMVPTMMNRVWRLPTEVRERYTIRSLKTLWHLAAPCPPWLKEAYIQWMGGEVIMELYAGTEAQSVTVISGVEWLEHRGSVGKVVSGEMQAFDDEGKPLPARTVGEIYMRKAQGAKDTYAYVGAAAKSLAGGWESLGDIGWFDEDGYLYLADRRTDMILVGGSNVYPAEIEAALEEHPSVQSSAVIGLPDDDLGNTIHAIVQMTGPSDEAGLRVLLADRLVTYKQPRTYEFVDAPLRDDAGKVRRSALREARLAAVDA